MVWTATYLGAVKRDGNLAYSIVYTDGTRRIVREYVTPRLDDNLVKQVAMTAAAALATTDDDASKMTLVAGSAIDLTPPPVVTPPAPTQAVLDKQAYLDAVQKATDAIRQQTAGAGMSQKVVDDLKANVAAKFKPEYLG